MKLEKDKTQNVVTVMVWFTDYLKMKYIEKCVFYLIYIYMIYIWYIYICMCIYIYIYIWQIVKFIFCILYWILLVLFYCIIVLDTFFHLFLVTLQVMSLCCRINIAGFFILFLINWLLLCHQIFCFWNSCWKNIPSKS